MNHIAPMHGPAIREIPLSLLTLAPENVRKTPPDACADAEIKASIAAHGLLENLVARPEGDDGAFAVLTGPVRAGDPDLQDGPMALHLEDQPPFRQHQARERGVDLLRQGRKAGADRRNIGNGAFSKSGNPSPRSRHAAP